MNAKNLIQDCCPPIFLRWARQFRNKNKNKNTFTGNYATWEEAERHASGYDSDVIFKQVREAALKVKGGEAVFERDSVCFYKEKFRWPALACLLSIAAEKGGTLNVLDFGGALGSFYFQHKKFFNRLKYIRWSVIEQAHFVECGRNELQNDALKFYANIDECVANEQVNVIFLSSVLQYLDNPKSILLALSNTKADYILIDRTPFIESTNDRLTVQSVPQTIYPASYPAWFFSHQNFNTLINSIGYKIQEVFDCDDDVGIGEFKGYFLARI